MRLRKRLNCLVAFKKLVDASLLDNRRLSNLTSIKSYFKAVDKFLDGVKDKYGICL